MRCAVMHEPYILTSRDFVVHPLTAPRVPDKDRRKGTSIIPRELVTGKRVAVD